ncbi:N-acetylmuramoyl-L-alanine amidase [Pontibacillus yanchengensis Y32]|uniref:N-acetylmuramoyl-L-alanine amidase n=1 Tax=Pontibacillus yanchengensis Y32 TaxID=1385514 RepID=A0A0A2TAA9_9BACI|nr:N-acetylmuramoyl-L-alanine amidase [Pontibacillus yanchengensis Y32]
MNENSNWVEIQMDNQTGWVANWLVSITNSEVSQSSMKVSPNVNWLRVRDGASTSDSVIGHIHKSDQYKSTQTKGDWIQITFKDKQGWVHKDYVSMVKQASTSNVSSSGSQMGTITVQTPSLNVRSKGSLTSKVVGSVKDGEQYPYVQEKNGWYEIKLGNGKKGWVANWLVTTSQQSTQTENNQLSLLYNATNIRSGPSTDTSIVGRGSKGDAFDIIAHENDWYKIKFNNQTAYVADWIVTTSPTNIEQLSSKKGTLKNKTIVIDAGHGGRDVGTIGASGMYEKNLVIKTANKLKERFELAGADVIMTRANDAYVSLSARATVSNVKRADAFLSLHYNSFPQSPEAKGIGTFYYHDQHREFARTVQNAMVQSTGLNNRKAKFGDFHVIRENRQPALLLELGFLSNEQEEKLVKTPNYQENITKGIVQGVSEYFTR